MLAILDSLDTKRHAVASEQAFFESEALVHLDALLKSAAQILRSVDEAQDVVQETYLRAWKHFGTYQRGSNGRGWLFRIMFNVMNDRRRKQWRHLEVPLDEGEQLEHHKSDVPILDPLRTLEGHEVLEATNLLSEEHRSVLWLVVVEEFSYREAGELLGVPIGTVMSRVHRARRELKRILTQRYVHREEENTAARAAGQSR